MVYTKCDRCGAPIEKEKKSIFEKIAEAMTKKATYSVMKNIGGKGHLIDLCESCQEALHEFLKGERKHQGKEIRQVFMDEIKVEK